MSKKAKKKKKKKKKRTTGKNRGARKKAKRPFHLVFLRGMRYKPAAIAAAILVSLVVASALAMNFAVKKYEVIMVVDDKACHCVKRRCVTLDTKVTELVNKEFKGRVKITRLQYRDKDTKKIMNKYNMGMVPAVVLINRGGEIKGNWHYYNFKIEDFKNTITGSKG